MDFDHFFIGIKNPDAAAHHLQQLGFQEGTANQHPGQGTANRRFFFDSVFVELLYVTDVVVLKSQMAQPLQLQYRLPYDEYLPHENTSPFGICFRPGAQASEPSFDTFDYSPAYLPTGLNIQVAPVHLEEPLWFFLRFAVPPADLFFPKQQLLQNKPEGLGISKLTHVSLALSTGMASTVLQQLAKRDDFDYVLNRPALLRLTFDNRRQGKDLDLRGFLPLQISY
jgi:hypothetical protein